MHTRRLLIAALALALPTLGLAQSPPAAAAAADTPAAPVAPAPAAPAAAEAPVAILPPPQLTGNVALRGRRFYIAEYRLLFEVAGSATASTRAGYMPGMDFGATRMTVAYAVPKPNIELFQAITDQAYADFLARMEAAGLKPEPTEAFTRENGAVYEATAEGSKPGAPVFEDVDVGHGKRKYLVMVPTGTKAVARGFIGLGAGNIGKRIDFSKANMEGVSVGMAVHLAAQESSGSGSSIFRRGSSANASAAMEIVMSPKMGGVLQAHARGGAVSLAAAMPVPGQFATLRESGGYDTSKDPAMVALNMVGRLALGVAGNNSKKVEMTVELDEAALQQQALKGITAVNAGVAAALQ